MSVKVDLLQMYGLDLEGAVRSLLQKGDWTYLLDLSARFRNYSPLNLLLIFSQACRRGFTPTIVAGYRGWQKLGRQVMRGEKALYIFAPSIKRIDVEDRVGSFASFEEVVTGYRLVRVFDVSQTTGDDLPVPPEPELLRGTVSSTGSIIERLEGFLNDSDYTLNFEILESVNGYTDFGNRCVKVRSDVSAVQQLKTLVHEIAHVIMHENLQISRIQAELEAESCAYVVCRALGVDSSSYSFPYIARWSQGDVELVGQVAQAVHGCSKEILAYLGV